MKYFRQPALLWLDGPVMDEVGACNISVIMYHISGNIMGEVGAHNIFDGDTITVVARNGYGQGRCR